MSANGTAEFENHEQLEAVVNELQIELDALSFCEPSRLLFAECTPNSVNNGGFTARSTALSTINLSVSPYPIRNKIAQSRPSAAFGSAQRLSSSSIATASVRHIPVRPKAVQPNQATTAHVVRSSEVPSRSGIEAN